MRVLIVSAVYPPEPVVSARLSRDLRNHLVSLGHRVQVLCPMPSRGAANFHGKPDHGVTRLDSYRCPSSKLLGRARESWDFGHQAARWLMGRAAEGYDVVYANMWPLFGPHHLVKAADRLEIPVVIHVQDVYPESLVTKLPLWLYATGSPFLKAWDRTVVSRCAAIVSISERIGRRYRDSRGLNGRLHVVRNWVDVSPFLVSHNREEVCSEYRVPSDRFTFMYLGNISALSGLESAICAFARMSDADTQLVIVGEGSSKPICQSLATELGLGNVLFRSEPDAAKVARAQTMADAFVLPTRHGGSTNSTPSKCISYMLSGKPILAAVDAESDLADDLRNAGCAWLCPAEDEEGLLAILHKAKAAPTNLREAMGDRGKTYALKQFDQYSCLSQLSKVIESVA